MLGQDRSIQVSKFRSIKVRKVRSIQVSKFRSIKVRKVRSIKVRKVRSIQVRKVRSILVKKVRSIFMRWPKNLQTRDPCSIEINRLLLELFSKRRSRSRICPMVKRIYISQVEAFLCNGQKIISISCRNSRVRISIKIV